LNENDSLVLGTEVNLLNLTGPTELFGGDLLKAGNNAGTGSNSEQLDLDTTDPADSGQIVHHEQVVGLIIETPLAKNHISTRVLNSLDHGFEVVAFHILELFVVGDGLDLNTVLGFGLWGLKGAGQDAHFGISKFLLHLGMSEVLVNNDTFNEAGVLNGSTGLGENLDEVEVDIAALEVSNVQNSLHGQVGKVILALADDLGAESGGGALTEEVIVVLGDVELLRDFVNALAGNLASEIETISDLERVNTLVEQLLGLLKDGTSQHNDTSGAIADFIIL